MKLSILDQAPMLSGGTAGEALNNALKLAQAAEKLGYDRFWMAEHHDLGGLACSAPEIMLGYIGAHTRRIRLGAGAILLPYYRPYKVAETFNLLATLFPGRIDLGIARSPGGSAEVSMALTDRYLDNVWKLPEAFAELLRFLDNDFPADHPNAKIAAAPLPPVAPEPWVLGTSLKSAKLAAENGTAYAYGLFMNRENAEEALAVYRESFRPVRALRQPYAILAVSALCAETAERAIELSLGSYALRVKASTGATLSGGIPSPSEARGLLAGEDEAEIAARIAAASAVGGPAEVRARLETWAREYEADELMILSYAHDFAERLASYERIAREFGIVPAE